MSRVPYKLLLQSSSNLERGSYPCSRTQIFLSMFKSVLAAICQKSSLALVGAFLIHVTLGTFYTLSNINSYMTSYIRAHGFPNATYTGSISISSAYAIGQGIAMIVGGFVERRFSARIACFIGCSMHSLATASTSMSLQYGIPGIVLTYGFFPGFGTGMSYMTPLSNAFGWFDQERRGFVAGIILAGFGFGTFVFNLVITHFVNPNNLSPSKSGYFDQPEVLDRVPELLLFIGSIYGAMQFVGCCLLFKPPKTNSLKRREFSQTNDEDSLLSNSYRENAHSEDNTIQQSQHELLPENDMSLLQAIKSRQFKMLAILYGIMTQGVLFVNSMLKNYGQTFIHDDMFLAWTGSMASIANGLGRCIWGLIVDRVSFSATFTSITLLFAFFIFTLPFEFVLKSKVLYLIWTLGIFGSFSGWMAIWPVQISREFGRTNSSLIYGLVFLTQSIGSIPLTFINFVAMNRYEPCFFIVFLEFIALLLYHRFYP